MNGRCVKPGLAWESVKDMAILLEIIDCHHSSLCWHILETQSQHARRNQLMLPCKPFVSAFFQHKERLNLETLSTSCHHSLILSQASPGFYVSAVQVF